MSTIRNTVTPKKLAANRSNAAKSAGPATPEGKDHARMNAFKHGRDAARPDPVELLLAGHTGAEESEREALREETLRAYVSGWQASGPADDFAQSEAMELADLRFELRRLERVREIVWNRERELLDLEQRRRAHALQHSFITATREEVRLSGLMNLEDSPAKWRTILQELEELAAQYRRHHFDSARDRVLLLYGGNQPLWRGERVWQTALECAGASPGAAFDDAYERLQGLVADEIEGAKSALELCKMEHEPLSREGQAARLLEAASSRKWNWLRQQENFLRRSIDRKVEILLELRAQQQKDLLAARREAESDVDRRPAATGSSRPPQTPQLRQKNVPKRRNEPTKSIEISEGMQTEFSAESATPELKPVSDRQPNPEPGLAAPVGPENGSAFVGRT